MDIFFREKLSACVFCQGFHFRHHYNVNVKIRFVKAFIYIYIFFFYLYSIYSTFLDLMAIKVNKFQKMKIVTIDVL